MLYVRRVKRLARVFFAVAALAGFACSISACMVTFNKPMTSGAGDANSQGGGGGCSTLSFVQAVPAAAGVFGANSSSASQGLTETTGDLLVAVMIASEPSPDPITVSDLLGNTWAAAGPRKRPVPVS